jgi:superfamily II DNA or RNA helicase
MPLDKENIRGNYSTDKHNVLGEFYLPTLKYATSYDRAVGYFSSKALLHIIQGLDGLINNGGKMRLVVGSPLKDDEYDSIKNNTSNSIDIQEKIFNEFNDKWKELIHSDLSELNKYRLEIFSWLAKTNKLEIQFALRKKGLFHKKIGVIKSDDFTVVFNGSLNETESAFENNSENFDVYRSWRKEAFEDHGEAHLQEFEDVWEGKENDTITFGIPSKCYEDIKNYWSLDRAPRSDLEKKAAEKRAEMFRKKEKKEKEEPNFEYDFIKPRLPKELGGSPYQIKNHQLSALEKWKAADYTGIMALATGAGKTITSIHGAVELSQNKKIVLVIAVPYRVLAEQWVEVLRLFNINPIKCWSPHNWNRELTSEINNFNMNFNDFLGIVVVNASLKNDNFQEKLKQVPSSQLFFIGDECHHHGEKGLADKLPNADYKLGLSATPWSKSELELKNSLESYYGGIVAEYTLQRAMDEKILTQYKYNIYPVYLNEEEAEAYEEISKAIAKMQAIKLGGGQINDAILQNLNFKRARLLDSLENKFKVLDELIKNKSPSPFTLFYSGSGSVDADDDPDEENQTIRSISVITQILDKYNWNSSQFTANETDKERTRILESFKSKTIEAIAAIKVLDEGFDVPMCREAYITASSRNERQFIQRRGRILRKAEGKTEAIIHDFVILHQDNNSVYKTLAENELIRVKEFYSSASNKDELLPQINKIKELFDIPIEIDKEEQYE